MFGADHRQIRTIPSITMATKHIFVTGGVVSSLGKGLTTASIGLLLESRGLRIRVQKFDPYLNVDAGTMNPYQHGEVYVLDDGGECDLDLGHYERFTNSPLSKQSNITTGRIYDAVIKKERRGAYLGACVQVVPHVTNEIRQAAGQWDGPDVDVVLTEIGGTVGDIEALPFLEAIRQFALDKGRDHCMFVHLTLLPHLSASGELKTKPTQHSVAKLREIGIQPDILVCRSEKPLEKEMADKIAMFCNVQKDCVIEERDVPHTIYEVPLMLQERGLDEKIVERLRIPSHNPHLDTWRRTVKTLIDATESVEIAVVGKYIQLTDAYKSVYESLTHAGIAHGIKVNLHRIAAEDLNDQNVGTFLRGKHGLLVPGGFGIRGIEGKISAVKFARENRLPFFGLCLGMQVATIEFARNVGGLRGATSIEFDRDAEHPVITLMDDQVGVRDKGGTMRLGSQACRLAPDSISRSAYGRETVQERHRHRYEFNNKYREELVNAGLVVAGVNPAQDLVEIIELADHPFYVAVQFHPEFKSSPIRPHPLFKAFVGAANDQRLGREPSVRAGVRVAEAV